MSVRKSRQMGFWEGLVFPDPFCAEVNAAMATPALFCFLFSSSSSWALVAEFDLKKIHGGPETGIIANYLDISLSVDLRNLSGKSGVARY